MKNKILFLTAIAIISISLLLFTAFKPKSMEDKPDIIMVSVYGGFGKMNINYGHNKTETIEIKVISTFSGNKMVIENDDIIVNTLNKLKADGYVIKQSISFGAPGAYSLFLEKN